MIYIWWLRRLSEGIKILLFLFFKIVSVGRYKFDGWNLVGQILCLNSVLVTLKARILFILCHVLSSLDKCLTNSVHAINISWINNWIWFKRHHCQITQMHIHTSVCTCVQEHPYTPETWLSGIYRSLLRNANERTELCVSMCVCMSVSYLYTHTDTKYHRMAPLSCKS